MGGSEAPAALGSVSVTTHLNNNDKDPLRRDHVGKWPLNLSSLEAELQSFAPTTSRPFVENMIAK